MVHAHGPEYAQYLLQVPKFTPNVLAFLQPANVGGAAAVEGARLLRGAGATCANRQDLGAAGRSSTDARARPRLMDAHTQRRDISFDWEQPFEPPSDTVQQKARRV